MGASTRRPPDGHDISGRKVGLISQSLAKLKAGVNDVKWVPEDWYALRDLIYQRLGTPVPAVR